MLCVISKIAATARTYVQSQAMCSLNYDWANFVLKITYSSSNVLKLILCATVRRENAAGRKTHLTLIISNFRFKLGMWLSLLKLLEFVVILKVKLKHFFAELLIQVRVIERFYMLISNYERYEGTFFI